jgi:hypothetical protein
VCEVELCYPRAIDGLLAGQKLCGFGTSLIYNGQYTIMSFAGWQVSNEVHRDILKWSMVHVCIEVLQGHSLSEDVGF